MQHWLCDTNIVSELMRRSPDENVWAWTASQDHFHLSVITVEEIYCGLERKQLVKKREWFQRFVAKLCTVVPVDEKIAERAGVLRGDFSAKGEVRAQADMLIAATAWRHSLSVVTRNTKDFQGCGVALFNPFE